ncbi:MAG: hypothetical protein JRG68_08295 [Deltaproteobacteria bacterium]|nr:hypothetical protein [Deltaproteobacteria bacterium]MBW2010696.1 hypothetical protein [Deltaproteobacteria bacterium]MBW2100733.1 hypothetical protein [Deltaproteobacteria bacterium]
MSEITITKENNEVITFVEDAPNVWTVITLAIGENVKEITISPDIGSNISVFYIDDVLIE